MKTALIKPTQGLYQTTKICSIIRETKTMYIVEVEGLSGEWRFNKADLLLCGVYKEQFPRWKLAID